ncbi:hypothetical protein MSG28_005952 [Choristoneura fumiferana]|uniref:Uncharacterized protein n=1 Tax=Choristoneura fumiferana TaxID=7141 RepID=A0ACC0L229_CHOFU|nr:hypothetical protein MSG28_005952 [Choristoneura fumiferana]
MARKKKISEEEAKLKKKEYDRKRREKMKSDPTSFEVLREKERLKYLKKKEKGQVKPISNMSSRERRVKRKTWKKNSQTYRDNRAKVRKNLTRLLDETPPPSPGPVIEVDIQNNNEVRGLVAARRRRQLRKRRAALYAKIAKLQTKLKYVLREKEKYRKRCQRQIKNVQTSPEAKVSALLKNVQVSDLVKKKLLLSEVITKQLKNKYKNLKKHIEKKKYLQMLQPDLLKKHKLLHLAKPFFKHDRYKKSGLKKLNAQHMKVKKDVVDFLEKDENSRMCPGKKDFIRSKGQIKQKRLLCDTLKNLHIKFLATVEYQVSLATFCRFRPFWVTWASIKERDTCKCVIHANVELMVMKLHELKALPCCNLTRFLAAKTCNVHSTKCLMRECEDCRNKNVEYYLPQPNKSVTYYQWQYETTSYEKDGKMKTVRKPVKKQIKVPIRKLVQQLEETMPLVFKHVATITHQYQMVADLKRKLTQNEVLIHIDFSENYCCKYNEEIQAVHFGGARQQVTLHTGVLYLRDNDGVRPRTFCSLSNNNRHDTMAVWAHLVPVFEWLKIQNLKINRIHMLSDSPVNQYKNKFMFHIVYRHINDLFPGTTFFSWHYSEPGHGKGAPDGVGGTLKRTADKAVAEGRDIVNLNTLKEILSARCPSIMLFEVNTANITDIEHLVKQSDTISAFRGTQKIRQFVFTGDVLEFRRLSCFDCPGKCRHYHLGYYSSSNPSITTKPTKVQTRTKKNKSQGESSSSNVVISSDYNSAYKIGDHVIVRWDQQKYPGELISFSEEAALVKCMKRGTKYWKWPAIKDEQLYAWKDVLQKIKPPTLIKRGCYSVKEID